LNFGRAISEDKASSNPNSEHTNSLVGTKRRHILGDTHFQE